jgi:hypothetical protein
MKPPSISLDQAVRSVGRGSAAFGDHGLGLRVLGTPSDAVQPARSARAADSSRDIRHHAELLSERTRVQ